MRYASVCSGVGVCKLAWPTWQTAFFAEIEKFPCKVLAHHWPCTPNLGDITAPDFIERALHATSYRRLDVFAGGTPCQAFSFAGKRQSLADDRGNLSLRFVELCDAINPRLVVWENVPGVLSTHDNAFGCFIGKLVGSSHPLRSGRESGGWPNAGMVAGPRRLLAWRVVDAQYCHLAQRRERVLVVAGRVGDGIDPGAILFEPEVMRRDSPPSRETRTQVAGSTASSVGIDGEDIAHAVSTRVGQRMNADQDDYIITGPLMANGKAAGSATNQDAYAGMLVTHTLTCEGFDASEDGTGRGTPLVPMVFDGARQSVSQKSYGPGVGKDGDSMYTLGAKHEHGVFTGRAVRRITPKEAERLQGMPDDHTAIPGASDSPRYKAIGNAWARNVFAWLGQRIEQELTPHQRTPGDAR